MDVDFVCLDNVCSGVPGSSPRLEGRELVRKCQGWKMYGECFPPSIMHKVTHIHLVNLGEPLKKFTLWDLAPSNLRQNLS